MTIPTVTPLPTAPSRSMQPATFVSTADTFLAALINFVTEVNNTSSAMNTTATNVSTSETNALSYENAANTSATNAATSATNAATSETNAGTSATNASNSATLAQNYATALTGTSTTSVAIGTGSKAFTTQSGKQFAVGQFVTVANTANAANYMHGQVTAYSGTSLTVNVTATGGSGTLASWNISISGTRGATGTGITPQTTGWTAAGGSTTVKTLTVDTDFTMSNAATKGANTFTGAQNYSDQYNQRAMFIDCGHVFLDKGNSGTTTQTLDYTAGSHQKITATGNHTIATSNWPVTGNLGQLLLELVNGGAYTLTFPTINWIMPNGTTTTSIATYLAANTGRVALQSSGTDFILLWSRDAGTTIYGKLI